MLEELLIQKAVLVSDLHHISYVVCTNRAHARARSSIGEGPIKIIQGEGEEGSGYNVFHMYLLGM